MNKPPLIVLTGPGSMRLHLLLHEKAWHITSSPFDSPSSDWEFFHVTLTTKEKTMSQNGKIRLANVYLEQGDTARQQGNIRSCVECFTRAINIYKEMAEEEPACWELVADTIEKVAATYKAAGELEKAEETFKEVVALRESMLKSKMAEDD